MTVDLKRLGETANATSPPSEAPTPIDVNERDPSVISEPLITLGQRLRVIGADDCGFELTATKIVDIDGLPVLAGFAHAIKNGHKSGNAFIAGIPQETVNDAEKIHLFRAESSMPYSYAEKPHSIRWDPDAIEEFVAYETEVTEPQTPS